VPRPGLENGHWMTLYAWGRPRHFPRLPRPTARYFDVAPDARVLAHCHWHEEPWRHPTLIALHGLEASSDAHYMVGLANRAFHAGFNVVRLNQRNCGGTEGLSVGLYHSGLTGDPAAVIDELMRIDRLPSIGVTGYSLGGNLAIKLAGDYGGNPPAALHSVSAVSPTLDLARCVEALERRTNSIYQWNFMRNLRRRMRRKMRLFPERYRVNGLGGIRTVRAFDEAITAPHHGFADASDYYYRASALRVADRIKVPTLIVSAEDDPFVPPDQFSDPVLASNPNITIQITPQGGHCGFVTASTPDDDGYWAEARVVEFAGQHARQGE
jgi:predicted alpha/beta-fold hydrolase